MVFLYELKKILLKQHALSLFLLVIAVAFFSMLFAKPQNYGFISSAERNNYLETISPFEGVLTEEKEKGIIALKEDFLEVKALFSKLNDEYIAGDIDEEYYQQMLYKYSETLNRQSIIDAVFERYEYVSADKENRMLIPAENVPTMSDISVNYLFLLCITFCCAYAVMIEYTGKTNYILVTTKGGQKNVMESKVIILLTLTALTSIIISTFDLVRLANELPIKYWNYSLCSIPHFETTEFSISIIGAFLISQLIKLSGYLFIAVSAMLTAHFTKHYVASVFPFIAVPVVADYLAEKNSQALFLPTGFLKGIGYFFGDEIYKGAGAGAEPVISFYHVPPIYTLVMAIAILIFIVIGGVILIKSGENRLLRGRRKYRHIIPVTSLLFVSLLCTACTSVNEGKTVDVLDCNENDRYKFEIIYSDNNESIQVTDKTNGESFFIPEDVFPKDHYSVIDIFPTENYLYYLMGIGSNGDSLYRIRLSDMTKEELIKPMDSIPKTALGLAFVDVDAENRVRINKLFTDEKNIFFIDLYGRVLMLNPFAKTLNDCTCIIEEDVGTDIKFDGKSIRYTDKKNVEKRYDTETKITIDATSY